MQINEDGKDPPADKPDRQETVPAPSQDLDAHFYQQMVETIPHLILYGDPQGSIIYHNGAMGQVEGMQGVSLIGRRWEEIIHAEDREEVVKAHKRAFAMGRRCYGECRYRCGPDTYKAATFISVPIIGAGGVFEYWVAVFTDISELKRVERNLLSSEAQNRTIINTLAEGLLILDEQAEIIFANQAVRGLLGYELEDLQSMTIDKILSRPKRRRGKPSSHEMIATRKNGSRFPVHISTGNYYLGYARHRTLLLRDITRSKTIERALEEKNHALLRSNEALDQFASIASHDLREPLRKVKSFAQLLARRFPENLPEEGRDYLSRMSKAVDRMDQLILSLLSYSRVTTDTDRFVTISLEEVIGDAVFDLEMALQDSGGRVETSAPLTLKGDPALLAQLFQNLISNSLKYRRQDVKPIIAIHAEALEAESEVEPPRIKIEVCDNGIGFDKHQAEHIFQIFQRLHDDEYEGAGVGLAICQKIVERHGGCISAAGTVGGGSTFTIILPSELNDIKIQ